MKRFLFLFFASLLVLTTGAQTTFTYQDVVYNVLDETTCEVGTNTRGRGEDEILIGEIEIPEVAIDETTSNEYSVVGIGSNAFASCYLVTSVVIPSSVTYLADKAFYDATGLLEIEVPSSVTTIGTQAFNGERTITKLTLNEGLVTVGDRAFESCAGLEELTLPSTVEKLGQRVFDNMTNLKKITILAPLTEIPIRTFESCTSLETINIPESVKTIGNGAFWYCTTLENITLPEGLESIEGTDGEKDILNFSAEGAFGGCTSLESITIPDNVTNLGAGAFYNCTNLKEVVIGNSIEIIKDDTFDACESLKSVTLGNSVKNISLEAFRGCSKLEEITLPETVEYIEHAAFLNCSNLAEVYSLNPTPPEIEEADEDNGAFAGIAEDCILYVPCEKGEAYAEAYTWTDFSTIIELACAEAPTFDVYPIDGSTLQSLNQFIVTCEDGLGFNEIGDITLTRDNEEIDVYVLAWEIENGTIATFEFYADEWGETEPLTYKEAGTYVITIPKNYFTLGEKDASEEIVLTYVVDGSLDIGTFVCMVDPESGSDVAELYDNVTFYNPTEGGAIYVNDYCAEVIEVYSEDETFVTRQAQFYPDFGPDGEDYSQTVYFEDRVSEEGTYYVNVPAELFIIYDEEGKTCYNEAMTLTYTISADAGNREPDYTLTFSPEDGSTLDILSTISISCEDGITRVLMPDEEITIVDSEGNNYLYSVVEVADDTGFVTEVDIILTTEIVDAGTYYVNVPVGYFDIGSQTNNAFTLTYTLTGTYTGIGGVSLNGENVDGIYTTSGQKINATVNGVNIIRFNDGNVKKIFVK